MPDTLGSATRGPLGTDVASAPQRACASAQARSRPAKSRQFGHAVGLRGRKRLCNPIGGSRTMCRNASIWGRAGSTNPAIFSCRTCATQARGSRACRSAFRSRNARWRCGNRLLSQGRPQEGPRWVPAAQNRPIRQIGFDSVSALAHCTVGNQRKDTNRQRPLPERRGLRNESSESPR